MLLSLFLQTKEMKYREFKWIWIRLHSKFIIPPHGVFNFPEGKNYKY